MSNKLIKERNLGTAGSLNVLSARNGQKEWGYILKQLAAHYGEATFKSWFSSMELAELHPTHIVLTVPTRFVREWVLANYHSTLLSLWQAKIPSLLKVDILIRASAASHSSDILISEDTLPSSSSASATVLDFTFKHLEENLSAPIDPRFTLDNFVVGKSNQLAFKAAKKIAEQGQAVAGCNPFFIHGGVGLGKTHLLHAIASHIRALHPHKNVIYITAERFMYQFIRSLRNNDILSFKEQFRAVDVLLVDDIQFISGKESTLEEFFHTFNTLVDNNRQIVISCDRCPSDLQGMGERARSRLGWGLVVDVQPADYTLRLGILKSKCEQLHSEVPAEVLEFLAGRISSNIRELEGALNRLIAHAAIMDMPLTVETALSLLEDLLRNQDIRITIKKIQEVVATHFNMSVADLQSARRLRHIARPRQLAMYLAKMLTTKSLIEIGRAFGGKDHTTVMHAVKKIESLMRDNNEINQDIAALQKQLRS